MSEPTKRHSTRERRPPKFRHMIDTEMGLCSEGRASEGKPHPPVAKEPLTSAQETNQLAKLLVKFMNSSNQKLRDIPHELYPQPQGCNTYANHSEGLRNGLVKNTDSRNQQGPLDTQNATTKHPRDGEHGAGQPTRNSTRPYVKRGEASKKSSNGLPGLFQSDLSYHTMLGQHIRSNLPDSHNLSAQMLMELGLPSKELLEQTKGKDNDRKKRTAVGTDLKISRQSREELKPFKRQSYHVAIAYHIFLKQIKSGPNPGPRDIDPTYNARKLRDQSQSQP